jgi:hypothetical protein
MFTGFIFHFEKGSHYVGQEQLDSSYPPALASPVAETTGAGCI